MGDEQLENSISTNVNTIHSSTDYNADTNGVFGPDEVLGCVHGLYRDLGDQWVGWFLYVVFVGLSIFGWMGLTGAVDPLPAHFLFIAIPYAFKVIEGFASPTFRYLLQAQTLCEMVENDKVLRNTHPSVVWGMVCSHTEQRTRRVTDSNGRSHQETYTVTIVTHTATEEVKYSGCTDCSPALPTPQDLTKNDITKYESNVIPQGPEFLDKRTSWVAHHSRDRHNAFTQTVNLCGMKKHSLLFRGEDLQRCCNKKTFVNVYVYTLALLSGYLGMPYRAYLSSITDRYRFDYRKDLTGITNKCSY